MTPDAQSWLHWGQVLLFWALALFMVALPMYPAWQEWRHPTDLNPLPVVRTHSGEARTFARRFQQWVAEHDDTLRVATTERDNSLVLTMGHQRVRLLGDPQAWWLTHGGGTVEEGLLAMHDMVVPAHTRCLWEVASQGDVRLGEQAQVRAVSAAQDLQVGEGACVHRWADAHARVRVARHAQLTGRCTAGQRLSLAAEVQFHRLSAPCIEVTGSPDGAPGVAMSPGEPPIADARRLPDWQPEIGMAMDSDQHTWLHPGSLTLPAGVVVRQRLVVGGHLDIGAGAVLMADVKALGRLSSAPGVQCHGAMVAMRDIDLGERTWVAGPLVGERHVHIGPDCQVGREEHLATVTARTIALAPRSRVHGSVWARVRGWTVSA